LTPKQDWYLYSGTPTKTDVKTARMGLDIPGPVEWMAFGDSTLDNDAVLLVNHTDDNHVDMYQSYTQMTVFGFGRDRGEELLNDAPRTFSMTLVPNATYEKLSTLAAQIVGGSVATAPSAPLHNSTHHATTPNAARIQLTTPHQAPAVRIQNGAALHTLSGQVVK
jgi:hypothetical protein